MNSGRYHAESHRDAFDPLKRARLTSRELHIDASFRGNAAAIEHPSSVSIDPPSDPGNGSSARDTSIRENFILSSRPGVHAGAGEGGGDGRRPSATPGPSDQSPVSGRTPGFARGSGRRRAVGPGWLTSGWAEARRRCCCREGSRSSSHAAAGRCRSAAGRRCRSARGRRGGSSPGRTPTPRAGP